MNTTADAFAVWRRQALRTRYARDIIRVLSVLPHYAALILFTTISILPLVWLAVESSKPYTEALTYPIRWIPTRFALFENVAVVFRMVPLLTYFGNSLFLVIVLATTDIVFSSAAGYALAKFKFPGRRVVFYFILSTTMISFFAIVVPQYILVRQLGWVDTYLGLMAPGFISAFGCFFMRQQISGIPNEYLDASRIDGASELEIFRRIIIPMIRPAIVTLAVFRFMWEWDSMFWPLVVTGKQQLRTLPLGLTMMVENMSWTPDYTITHVLTASLLAVLPVLFVFLFLQRQFMSAMTMSGLRG